MSKDAVTFERSLGTNAEAARGKDSLLFYSMKVCLSFVMFQLELIKILNTVRVRDNGVGGNRLGAG